MATPTDQQQIRATLRRHERAHGTEAAASLAIGEAMDVLGIPAMLNALKSADGLIVTAPNGIPPLMGTAEVAAAFGIANSNISKLADPPLPVAKISGGKVPVYLASEVMAKVQARNAARGRS